MYSLCVVMNGSGGCGISKTSAYFLFSAQRSKPRYALVVCVCINQCHIVEYRGVHRSVQYVYYRGK